MGVIWEISVNTEWREHMRRTKGFFLFCAIVLLLTSFSCSPVIYNTVYEGGHDPLFDIKAVKTIGFAPYSWTKKGKELGMDELFEKQLFVYAKNELTARGFNVFYIYPENLIENKTNGEVYVRESYANMPDLMLTLGYSQRKSNVVHVPGQAYGSLYKGIGSYYQTEGYDVQAYSLNLAFTLWSGPPKFMNKVWAGAIAKGSPELNLSDKAQEMTKDVFEKKFDIKDSDHSDRSEKRGGD